MRGNLTIAMLSYRRLNFLLSSLEQYHVMKPNICLRVQGAEDLSLNDKKIILDSLDRNFTAYDVQFTYGNHGTGVPRHDVVTRALKHFDTPYIATFDDDILFPNGAIGRMMVELEKDKALGALAMWCKPNYNAWILNKKEGKIYPTKPIGPIHYCNACGSGTKIVKREAFEKIPLDPNFYRGWQDICWGYELTTSTKFRLGILAEEELYAINRVSNDKVYYDERYNREDAKRSWEYFYKKHLIMIDTNFK